MFYLYMNSGNLVTFDAFCHEVIKAQSLLRGLGVTRVNKPNQIFSSHLVKMNMGGQWREDISSVLYIYAEAFVQVKP